MQAHEKRDDVFLWRGRTLLQPFTTVGEDGNDVYTVVDDDTGEVRKATRSDQRVRLVRGEGRGVSNQYGVRDAACPLSTG